MEEGVSRKKVEVSDRFYKSYELVYDFGMCTFGFHQAERYAQQIRNYLSTLSTHYMAYPECRHLATQSHRYRNIILDSHLIIYRITASRIEVLDMIHSASGIRKIRGVRKIRIRD